jgi:hypothetical protein
MGCLMQQPDCHGANKRVPASFKKQEGWWCAELCICTFSVLSTIQVTHIHVNLFGFQDMAALVTHPEDK